MEDNDTESFLSQSKDSKKTVRGRLAECISPRLAEFIFSTADNQLQFRLQ